MPYLNPVADEETWLQVRQQGIGGSDASVVLGWSPWATVRQLWRDKMGMGEPFQPTRFTEWGSLLEPVILQKYARHTGMEILGRDVWGRAVIFDPDPVVTPTPATPAETPDVELLNPLASPWRPFMRANVDGYLLEDRRVVKGLEVKTTSAWAKKKWRDGIPPYYLAQCLHCRRVLRDLGHDLPWEIMVLVGGNDFGRFPVDEYPWLVEELVERERRFWQCVETNAHPDPADFTPIPVEEGIPMAVTVSEPKGGFTRILSPDGLQQGVLVDVVDRGTVKQEWNGEESYKPKVSLHFLLAENIPEDTWIHPFTGEEIEVHEKLAGRPYGISKWFTASLHENASLRKFLRMWRGRDFTPDELKGFDLEQLLGVNAMLTIVHVERNGNYYANIEGVAKLPKNYTEIPIPEDYVRFKDREDEEEDGGKAASEADDDLPF